MICIEKKKKSCREERAGGSEAELERRTEAEIRGGRGAKSQGNLESWNLQRNGFFLLGLHPTLQIPAFQNLKRMCKFEVIFKPLCWCLVRAACGNLIT